MSSSVINATAVLSLPDVSAAFHSIIVICTIHMSSEADRCLVTVESGNIYRSGMYTHVHMYVHLDT